MSTTSAHHGLQTDEWYGPKSGRDAFLAACKGLGYDASVAWEELKPKPAAKKAAAKKAVKKAAAKKPAKAPAKKAAKKKAAR